MIITNKSIEVLFEIYDLQEWYKKCRINIEPNFIEIKTPSFSIFDFFKKLRFNRIVKYLKKNVSLITFVKVSYY